MNRYFKNGLAVFSSLSILFAGAGTTAFADTSGHSSSNTISTEAASTPKAALSQNDAIALATKLFSIPSSMGQPNISLQNNKYQWDAPVYEMNWQSPSSAAGQNRQMHFFHVSMDANTGQVISFFGPSLNTWDVDKTIQLDDASSLAKAAVQKYAPDEYSNLKLVSSSLLDGSIYQFVYVQMVNGIPAPFNTIQLSVDNTGQIMNYQVQWHKVAFPAPSSTISLDKASDLMHQNINLHLQYNQSYSQFSQKYFLTYTPSTGNVLPMYMGPQFNTTPWIDAKSGNFINQFGQPTKLEPSVPIQPIQANGPSEWPSNLAQALTQDQAEQVARTKLKLPSSESLDNANLQPRNGPFNPDSVWFLSFSDKNGNRQSVGIDAVTGIVVQYFQMPAQNNANNSKQMLSTADLQKDATQFLSTLFPNSTGIVALNLSSQSPNKMGSPSGAPIIVVSGQISLLKNHIPVPCGGLSINAQTGQVMNYSFQFNPQAEYPDANSAISLSDATALYFNAHPVQLQYFLPTVQTGDNPGNQPPSYAQTAVLVYGLAQGDNESKMLNAMDGTWTSFGDSGSNKAPTDVSGHYGEKEMDLLAERGILPMNNGKVNPDQNMTRGEFVSILSRASGMMYGGGPGTIMYEDVSASSPYYQDIESALLQGWLLPDKDFNPDKPITRIQAAEMIVRWFNWQTLASQQGLFNVPFQDKAQIPTQDLGDATIVANLGIIPAQNSDFNPDAPMTVADTSVAIVNTMKLSSQN